MVCCSTAGSIETAPAVTPAPQPITSTFFGVRGHERRQVAEHPLQPHVLRLARRLDLAGVVIVAHAVLALRHGDGGVPALADVDDVGLPQLRRPRSGRRRRACRARRLTVKRERATATTAAADAASTVETLLVPHEQQRPRARQGRSAAAARAGCRARRRAAGSRQARRRWRRACSRRRRRRPGGRGPRPSTRPRRARAESSRPRGSRRAAPREAPRQIELELEPGSRSRSTG